MAWSSATATATGARTAARLLERARPAARARPARRLALRRRDRGRRAACASTPRRAAVSGSLERVITGLPDGGNHWTRTVALRPRRLAVRVDRLELQRLPRESDQRRAAIVRFDRGRQRASEIYATGLRNSVGFDWQPGDRRAVRDRQRPRPARRRLPALRAEPDRRRAGSTAGRSPTATACPIPTSAQGERGADRRLDPAGARLRRAHRAARHDLRALGARRREAYRGAALVALHGSWNRTTKDGYKVVSLHWQAATARSPSATS